MEFKDFYKLLNGAIEKAPTDVVPSGDNFNTYIFNRFLSFHTEFMPMHLSKTVNRVNWLPDAEDEQMAWKGIRACLPKLPKRFIEYVKKPSVEAAQELGVTEEWIEEEARLNECSKREIRDLILSFSSPSNKNSVSKQRMKFSDREKQIYKRSS